jgi:hypothetical protein
MVIDMDTSLRTDLIQNMGQGEPETIKIAIALEHPRKPFCDLLRRNANIEQS